MLLLSLSLSWTSRTKGVAQLHYLGIHRDCRAPFTLSTMQWSGLVKNAFVMVISRIFKSTSYCTARKDFLWWPGSTP